MAIPAQADINVTPGAPSGFEQLEAAHGTVIVVYYGGETLGSFPAHVTPSTIAFDDVNAMLALIPALKNKPAIKTILQNPMPNHADLLCRQEGQRDCGSLTPDSAGVIFDESRLSAELFINHGYLNVKDDTGPRYLPLPEQRFSSVYGFDGAINGSGSSSPNFTLGNNAVLAYGETRLSADSIVSNRGLRFDSATAGTDRDGLAETAGLFRSRAMQLITDRDIAGVSVSTSLKTRLDARKVESNDIIVYLPRRAIVSIYREGRLYSARSYEAGNQTIDTSEMPEGAYTITLKIEEADGTTREETRFLAKSPDIPPPGIPTYYAQAGVIRQDASNDSTIPELTSHPLLRVGTVRRIDDNLGLDLSLLGLDKEAAMEAGTFLLYKGMQVRTTLLASSRGDMGVQGSYLQVMDKWNATIDARRVWAAENHVPYLNAEDIDPLPQSLAQVSGTLSYTITPDFSMGLRENYFSQQGAMHQSYGPTAQWYLWREGESMLSFSTDAGRDDHRVTGDAFLRFTMRFGAYGASGSGGFNHSEGNNGPSASARLWHDDTMPERALLLGAGIAKDPHLSTASADGDFRDQFGRMHGIIQDSEGKNGNTATYGGNFTFNAAQLDNELHVGGDQADMSAVIIQTSGDGDVPMRVFVNGTERGLIDIGHDKAIYLTPYQTYQIHLRASKGALLDYDNNDRKVTLYPGNVARLRYAVNHFYVVLAHIADEKGAALDNALLQESRDQTATDEKGRLQAQLSHPKRLTFITRDDNACEVALPDNVKPVNGVLVYKEPLKCAPIMVMAGK